ncbi:MAG: hypothetical protein AAGF24_00130 [Cyanobacteria bacterium P01_H01_bin.121]
MTTIPYHLIRETWRNSEGLKALTTSLIEGLAAVNIRAQAGDHGDVIIELGLENGITPPEEWEGGMPQITIAIYYEKSRQLAIRGQNRPAGLQLKIYRSCWVHIDYADRPVRRLKFRKNQTEFSFPEIVSKVHELTEHLKGLYEIDQRRKARDAQRKAAIAKSLEYVNPIAAELCLLDSSDQNGTFRTPYGESLRGKIATFRGSVIDWRVDDLVLYNAELRGVTAEQFAQIMRLYHSFRDESTATPNDNDSPAPGRAA